MISPPYIAVVDDDPSVGKSLKRLIHRFGLQVRVFTSPAEFLLAVKQRAPECLVVDLQMPEISGLEVQQQLLSQGLSVPIIFITAQPNEDVRRPALERGAKGFISKPFDAGTMQDLIVAAGLIPQSTPTATPNPTCGLHLQSRLRPRPAFAPPSDRPTDDFVDFELRDLLPCPFCQAYPRLEGGTLPGLSGAIHHWARITCPRCGAGFRTASDAALTSAAAAEGEVVQRWNRRSPAARLNAPTGDLNCRT